MVVLYSIRANYSEQDMLLMGAKACQVRQQARSQTQTPNSTKLPERHQSGATGSVMKSYGSFENSLERTCCLLVCHS